MKYYTFYRESNKFDDILNDINLKKIVRQKVSWDNYLMIGIDNFQKDVDKILEGIKKGDWKIKKFFRLHPPIKGFKKSTKKPVPQGVLGKNKDIAKLLEKML